MEKTIAVERTGHDYDFIAIVTYSGTEPALLVTDCLECGNIINAYTSGGPHVLRPGETFGILADPEGWGLLEALEADSYSFEEAADFTPREYLDATCAEICTCNMDKLIEQIFNIQGKTVYATFSYEHDEKAMSLIKDILSESYARYHINAADQQTAPRN